MMFTGSKYKFLENVNDIDIENESRIVGSLLTRIDIRLENKSTPTRDFVNLSRHRMELFEYHKTMLEEIWQREKCTETN